MANGERRMLFDIRGKRRHVIKVVYAILALLMGASLFFVVGPVNIGELLGNNTTTTGSSAIFDEQAEKVERKLAKDPQNEALLLALTRTRINAGNQLVEVDATTGQRNVTPEAKAEFEQATEAWERYKKQAGEEISPSLALLAASTFYTMATNATTYEEAFEALGRAEAAQEIVAEARPSLGAFASLAYYQNLNGNFAAADESAKSTKELATSKTQRKEVEKQMAAFRKQGKEVQKQAKAIAKAEKGKGKESLENAFSGLGGGPTIAP